MEIGPGRKTSPRTVEEFDRVIYLYQRAIEYETQLQTIITSHSEVHIFTDASTRAYGAVMYLITPVGEGCPENKVQFLVSKGKIVPINKVVQEDTVPRWETLSIVVGTLLYVWAIEKCPKLRGLKLNLWNDSKVALSWCSSTNLEDTFISRRVKMIRPS